MRANQTNTYQGSVHTNLQFLLLTILLGSVNRYTADAAVQPHCQGKEPSIRTCSEGEKPPFDKHSSIGVVGGGFAGVAITKLLVDRGYTNLRVFEKSNRVGGYAQTQWIDGIPHERATCYTIGRYECVLRWINETGGNPVSFEPSMLEFKYNTAAPARNLNQYWIDYACSKQLLNYTLCVMAATDNSAMYKLTKEFVLKTQTALRNHNVLYNALLGDGKYLFRSNQPTEAQLRLLSQPYGHVLKLYNLTILYPAIYTVLSQQGYGYIDTLSTLYALTWMSPQLVRVYQAIFNGTGHDLPPGVNPSVLREGFGTFVQQLARPYQEYFTLNANVTHIKRHNKTATSTISYFHQGKLHDTNVDFLIVAARVTDVLQILELSSSEHDVFTRLHHRYLTIGFINDTTQTTPVPGVLHNIQGISSVQYNKIFGVRDPVKLLFPTLSHSSHTGAVLDTLLETTGQDSRSQLQLSIQQQFKNDWNVTLSSQDFLFLKTYDYNSVFAAGDIEKAYPWKLWDLQGTANTWFVGSFASFESFADILDYNYQLLDKKLCQVSERNMTNTTNKCTRGFETAQYSAVGSVFVKDTIYSATILCCLVLLLVLRTCLV
jgi:uncharacterized protein with NAD-binding domain and iron-sulfur cluster